MYSKRIIKNHNRTIGQESVAGLITGVELSPNEPCEIQTDDDMTFICALGLFLHPADIYEQLKNTITSAWIWKLHGSFGYMAPVIRLTKLSYSMSLNLSLGTYNKILFTNTTHNQFYFSLLTSQGKYIYIPQNIHMKIIRICTSLIWKEIQTNKKINKYFHGQNQSYLHFFFAI